jgi:chromosome segregation ATPase
MMYVTAALRGGIGSVQQNLENQELHKQNLDLKEQIRVYDALKDQQIQDSSDEEQQVYQRLMSKLTLLQDEARDEKDQLRKKAKENEEKEFALNQYQQIVRNIINTNLLAKTQIKRKDTLIETKNVNLREKQKVIQEQETEIAKNMADIENLEESVEQKEQTISENQQKIDQINQALESKLAQLREEQKSAKISKAQLKAEMDQLTQESQSRIADLEAKKRQTQAALEQTRQNLGQVQEEIVEQQKQSAAQREALMAEMEQAKTLYQGQIQALQSQHQEQIETERQARENLKKLSAKKRAAAEAKLKAEQAQNKLEYEQAMRDLKGKISQSEQALAENQNEVKNLKSKVEETAGRLAQTEAQKAAAEAEKARLAAEKARLAGSLAETQGNLEKTQGALQQTTAEKARAMASVDSLEKEKQNLSGELKRAQEIANAKKKLIGQIKKNLKDAGLDAEVDGKTGDVIISFGEEYFDTGSSQLKPNMRDTLHKFMPAYSESLFNDPNTSEKITNVEIIGFASPTFNGRYVNPESLDPKDQEAIRYNVKLSSSRAQSIFNYIFDTKKLKYQKQKDLLPKVKVVGRGYLPEGKKWQDIPKNLPEKEFCKRFNCQKAQRVIIRFNMEN